MADLVITEANVKPGTGALVTDGTAGQAINAGQTVYLDSTDNKYKLADANLTAATGVVRGISVNKALADGQPLSVIYSGNIELGAIVTKGEIYVQSATAGGIAPEADLASGHRVSILGVGFSTTEIKLVPNFFNSSVQL